ncbi:MAG TPA: hypothetical protein VII82_15405 [Polyangiaceae bacterium]
MPIKFEPLLTLPSLVSGMWRRFGVHAFEGHVTLEDMTRIEASGSHWHRTNPGQLVELVVIFPSDARMSAEERTRMASLVKRWEKTRTASATVVLADGLAGAMHRSVLTGLQMIAPPPHPTKVFSRTPDAVAWLAPYVQALCGADATAAELLAAIDRLCDGFRSARRAAT